MLSIPSQILLKESVRRTKPGYRVRDDRQVEELRLVEEDHREEHLHSEEVHRMEEVRQEGEVSQVEEVLQVGEAHQVEEVRHCHLLVPQYGHNCHHHLREEVAVQAQEEEVHQAREEELMDGTLTSSALRSSFLA